MGFARPLLEPAESGEVVLTKHSATPYLVVAFLLNRLGVTKDHRAHVMYGRSGNPGILRYLLQCGVKMPEIVEKRVSSALPSGRADAQSAEQRSTDASQYFVDEAEDYEKAIGARSQGLIFASTLWDN